MQTVRYATVQDRILANVKRVPAPSYAEVQGDCWEWQGSTNARGYGTMSVRKPWRGKPYPFKVLVHRLVLTVFCGIPDMEIEVSAHQCSNKRCVNPAHLSPQTADQNRDFYYQVERLRACS